MKLGLGTAQFGMTYGISNKSGKVPFEKVKRILGIAAECGIEILDTAATYGDSEVALGGTLPVNHKFHIITKTPRFEERPRYATCAQVLREGVHRSLERTRQQRLHGLLIHHSDDLHGPEGKEIVKALRDAKEAGWVEKVGVSIYTEEQIDRILSLFTPDIVQLPVNLFDQRLIASGHISRLAKAGVEVHARSVFLQGLLLMRPEETPDFFSPIMEHLRSYDVFLKRNGLSRLLAALQFIKGVEGVDAVVVGVCSVEELAQVVETFESAQAGHPRFREFAISDERFVNPSHWNIN